MQCSSCCTGCTSLALLTCAFVGFCLCIAWLVSIRDFVSHTIPLHYHLTLLFPLVTGFLVSLPIWLFTLSPRIMPFFIYTMHDFCFLYHHPPSPKLRNSFSPLGVACGSCYCRRYIVLLVGTLVPERLPTLYCCIFDGLVCLKIYLLLFGVVTICNHSKPSSQAPTGLLHPVKIPCECFELQSMDFITDLLLCGRFNGVYTCVDKLTKFVKIIPISIGEGALLSPQVACLFFEHVVQFFGIPRMVLHDYDAHFTTHFWCCLQEIFGSWVALSSAYHPNLDGLRYFYPK